jgi:hypothetical protein
LQSCIMSHDVTRKSSLVPSESGDVSSITMPSNLSSKYIDGEKSLRKLSHTQECIHQGSHSFRLSRSSLGTAVP